MITCKSNHFLISGLTSLSQAGSLLHAEEARIERVPKICEGFLK